MEDGQTDLLIEKEEKSWLQLQRKGAQQSEKTEDGGEHGVLVIFNSEVCLKATTGEVGLQLIKTVKAGLFSYAFQFLLQSHQQFCSNTSKDVANISY